MSKAFEVLLREDISTLGKRGTLVKVRPGYARNYLIPRGMAVVATKENMRLLEVEKKRMAQMEAARKEELVKIAKELEVTACTIETKANDEGHLFGSVTYAIIAEKFKGLGFDVKEEGIELEDATLYPIKELGIFSINIKLHPEVVAKSKVWVVSEQEKSE